MKQLANKKTVVTGSSEGIGFGIAEAFARNGASVWLVGRDLGKLEKASQQLQKYGVELQTTSIDLYGEEAAKELAKAIAREWGSLDVLVNNAGLSIFTPFTKVSSEEFEQQLTLNVRVS